MSSGDVVRAWLAMGIAAVAALVAVGSVDRPSSPGHGGKRAALAAAAGVSVHLPIALDSAALGREPGMPGPVGTPAPPFARYVPVEVRVVPDAPDYTPDLGRASNSWLAQHISPAAREALERNGFVVIPSQFSKFDEVYSQGYAGSIPPFVTTDALLHTFHALYGMALRDAEKSALMTELRTLTTAMVASAERQAEVADGVLQAAATQNLAFFAVADRLLDPSAAIPAGVRHVVLAELQLISAHGGVSQSPIFGYDEDYSQYVPRGHYTRDEDFQRYFRAMMWYGHMAFRLNEHLDAEIRRRETRAALLTTYALRTVVAGEHVAIESWDRIYDVTAFFVGTADDLTVHDYERVARQVYGESWMPGDLTGVRRLDEFIEAARRLRPPAILNTPLHPGEDRVGATMGFRFMGQRFIPDSAIFQQLVYDEVKGSFRGQPPAPFTEYDTKRSFPRALDVAAALGSARALAILTADRDTDYEGYAEQLASVRDEFAALDAGRWSSNLYWSWLDSLRPLLRVPGEGFPFFMRTGAWVDKSLSTWLGSWSQLRHDTILYAKPSMPVPMARPLDTDGYVEPNPWLFARLAALCSQMRAGLTDRGLLSDDMAGRLGLMEALLLDLKTISETELVGQVPTDAQQQRIRGIASPLAALVRDDRSSHKTDREIAVVADVHSVPRAGLALEEGVGDAFEIYVLVPQPSGPAGEQLLTRGAVFSYYEFKWPMADRLTDEAWQAMDPRPPMPGWTESFIVWR